MAKYTDLISIENLKNNKDLIFKITNSYKKKGFQLSKKDFSCQILIKDKKVNNLQKNKNREIGNRICN